MESRQCVSRYEYRVYSRVSKVGLDEYFESAECFMVQVY